MQAKRIGFQKIPGFFRVAALAIAILPRSAAAESVAPAKAPTYSKDIAPIFFQNCADCHRPGEIAPMSLLTYEEVRPWVKAIKKTVAGRLMPPWDAEPGYGKFANDISLTPAEIETIVQWADQGAAQGDPADLPAYKAKPPAAGGWHAGVPDLALIPKVGFTVPATERNDDIYQCIVLPLGLKEDMWVTNIEYKPDQRSVVHHIIGILDTEGTAPARDAATPEPGFPCGMASAGGLGSTGWDSMLGGWAPGTRAENFEPGLGKLFPAGSSLILQMHYHNETGAEVVDRSGIGLKFAKEPIKARSRLFPVSAWNIKIAAGDPNAEHRARWRVPQDINVFALMPHMHFIGKDMIIGVTYPDGRDETLLDVRRYSFDRQTAYDYVESKHVPKGSVIHMISHHDNSPENPANPSKPPIDLKWGESTTEEMAIAWIGYSNANENLGIQPKEFKADPGVGQSGN